MITLAYSFLVGWLVCQQDYTKTTEWISTKIWMEDVSQPEIDPLTFDACLDKETPQGISFLTFLIRCFFQHL